jgi:hypothetical protein
MATLKEKIVGLMPGNPERDSAVEAELDNIRAADKVAGTLYQRMEKVQHARSAKIRELDAASLTAQIEGNDTAYKKLQTEIAKLDEESKQIEGAQRASAEIKLQAEQRLHTVTNFQHTQRIKKKANQRIKALTEIIEGYKAAIHGFKSLTVQNDQTVATWPFGQIPAGHLLTPSEVHEALIVEIARLDPHDSLDPTPTLPGGSKSTYFSPFTVQPMLELMEQSNISLVALIEQGPK